MFRDVTEDGSMVKPPPLKQMKKSDNKADLAIEVFITLFKRYLL